MFHTIPHEILSRMAYLERIDARDRKDGTPKMKRLKQIPPETGRFLALWLANAPRGEVLEIGTSAGYSTLWLTLACRHTHRQVITFEVLPDKARLAAETFAQANVTDIVTLRQGDARHRLDEYAQVAFCFLDADKDVYDACFDAIVPGLVSGGVMIADNVISHQEVLRPFVDKALGDDRLDGVVVPIGKGLLLCRKK